MKIVTITIQLYDVKSQPTRKLWCCFRELEKPAGSDCPTLKFLKHSKELFDWQLVFVLLTDALASTSDLSFHKE